MHLDADDSLLFLRAAPASRRVLGCRRSARCDLPREFNVYSDSDFFVTRHKLGWQAGSPCRLLHQKETARVPKSNRMPRQPHSINVETQIVDGVQDLPEQLIGRTKMTQVGA